MSIDTALKDYILAQKDVEGIISEFIALFPQFATYSNELLEVYIDITFFVLPAWVINVGFNTTYKMYLYAFAHILVSQGVQSNGSSSSDDDRISSSMSAGGLSISYKQLGQSTEIAEWEYFFGNTNYGKMVLLFLKSNGLGASKGVFVV